MTGRPKREQAILVELNLLREKFLRETDADRKQEIQREIEKLEREISQAHRE